MPTTRLTPEPTPPESIQALLHRPASERVREYKYRFAQAVVFGLPVIVLELIGPKLGGPEAGRWLRFMQGLLAGWVIYVGAAGMLFEGLLLLRRRMTSDLPVAAGAMVMYGAGWIRPGWFSLAVGLVAVWTGIRWLSGCKWAA